MVLRVLTFNIKDNKEAAKSSKAVHDKVNTFEINLMSLPLPAYILTGVLSDLRPGKREIPEKNPPTDGIVQHDSRVRKFGATQPGIEPGSPWWETFVTDTLRTHLFADDEELLCLDNLDQHLSTETDTQCMLGCPGDAMVSSYPPPPLLAVAIAYGSGSRVVRCRWKLGFHEDLPFPPLYDSGSVPYSPRFTLIGFQDLDVKGDQFPPDTSASFYFLVWTENCEFLLHSRQGLGINGGHWKCFVTRHATQSYWEDSFAFLAHLQPRRRVQYTQYLNLVDAFLLKAVHDKGATVVKGLARSPPTPVGSLPDFRKRKSCRTMPLVGGYSRKSPPPPTGPSIPALMHTHLASPSSAPTTTMFPPKSIHYTLHSENNFWWLQLTSKVAASVITLPHIHSYGLEAHASFEIKEAVSADCSVWEETTSVESYPHRGVKDPVTLTICRYKIGHAHNSSDTSNLHFTVTRFCKTNSIRRLLHVVIEFLWPPSGSIIRSAQWYRHIVLSWELHIAGSERAGETRDTRENPPTSGIVRHDSHMRESNQGHLVVNHLWRACCDPKSIQDGSRLRIFHTSDAWRTTPIWPVGCPSDLKSMKKLRIDCNVLDAKFPLYWIGVEQASKSGELQRKPRLPSKPLSEASHDARRVPILREMPTLHEDFLHKFVCKAHLARNEEVETTNPLSRPGDNRQQHVAGRCFPDAYSNIYEQHAPFSVYVQLTPVNQYKLYKVSPLKEAPRDMCVTERGNEEIQSSVTITYIVYTPASRSMAATSSTYSRANPLRLLGRKIMQGDMHRGKEGLGSHGLHFGAMSTSLSVLRASLNYEEQGKNHQDRRKNIATENSICHRGHVYLEYCCATSQRISSFPRSITHMSHRASFKGLSLHLRTNHLSTRDKWNHNAMLASLFSLAWCAERVTSLFERRDIQWGRSWSGAREANSGVAVARCVENPIRGLRNSVGRESNIGVAVAQAFKSAHLTVANLCKGYGVREVAVTGWLSRRATGGARGAPGGRGGKQAARSRVSIELARVAVGCLGESRPDGYAGAPCVAASGVTTCHGHRVDHRHRQEVTRPVLSEALGLTHQLTIKSFTAAVAEGIDCLPLTKASRVQSPPWTFHDLRACESCRPSHLPSPFVISLSRATQLSELSHYYHGAPGSMPAAVKLVSSQKACYVPASVIRIRLRVIVERAFQLGCPGVASITTPTSSLVPSQTGAANASNLPLSQHNVYCYVLQLAPAQLQHVIGDPPRPPLSLERCARSCLLLFWESREYRQRRDLLASETSSCLLEFPIPTQECSGDTGWRLRPPRRITRIGEDSRWRPKTLYILPQPSGWQSLMEAAWPSVRERNAVIGRVGAMLTGYIGIRKDPGSNPGPAILISVFEGFPQSLGVLFIVRASSKDDPEMIFLGVGLRTWLIFTAPVIVRAAASEMLTVPGPLQFRIAGVAGRKCSVHKSTEHLSLFKSCILVPTSHLPNRRSQQSRPIQPLSAESVHGMTRVTNTMCIVPVPCIHHIWPITAANEPMRVKRGGYEAVPECTGGGKRKSLNETLRPAASSGTIPTCENPGVTLSGNEAYSPRGVGLCDSWVRHSSGFDIPGV
ncbi:hypothetical protein PR048_030257 [Dryococelus australis]|uniref:Uncharacterized protein n=1 Tax=Dryococelus australis TaxID=614101 RepID=A0ABQ9G8H0_9NEOP|nr:hypothetical protein PR048_030257 [Dryococelus australis]